MLRLRLQMHLDSQSSLIGIELSKAVSWVGNAVSVAGYREPTSTSWQWPWAHRGYCQGVPCTVDPHACEVLTCPSPFTAHHPKGYEDSDF